jgi:GNAT superfamily N-acetyltransferase
MQPRLRPFEIRDTEPVIELSLRAWEPVFASMAATMDPQIERRLHPDWRASQRHDVEACLISPDHHVWVAEIDGGPVGFVAGVLRAEQGIGEIHMLAVDPAHQGRGVGRALTDLALGWMRDAGMTIGMVDTGGDPGHAPARRTYEQAGFTEWPITRYFKAL